MADTPNRRGRRPGGPARDHDRTHVFRRDPGGGIPDKIDSLYRPRRTEQGAAPPPRRQPPTDRPRTPRRPPARDGRSRGGPVRRAQRGRAQRRRKTAAVLLVLLLVTPLLFYFWADSRLHRVDALPDYEGRPGNQPGTTYLIVGSDSREGLSDDDISTLRTGRAEGKRTDTIMVLYVPRTGKPTIISVPRDSYVDIPGIGANKINAAFAEALGGGPATLVRSFEQASGVRVDHYVEIGFAGFVDIVDAVGGVRMCPKEPMQDPKAALDIEAGCQEMDGATALGYVRTRATARADLDRIQRQREFFSALVAEATSPATLANPFRSVPLVVNSTATFSVDEGDRLLDLARMALAMRDSPATTTVPVGSTPTLDVGSVVLWDEARSEEMFAAIRGGEEIPESALQD